MGENLNQGEGEHRRPAIRTVRVTRYVTPLREGGSLPAIVEADDLGTYVLKFRGAGQGPRVLVAELLAGELGRALGLPVPEIVLMELDPILGRSEPDGEVQALVQASGGLNLGLDYLPGSFTYDPLLSPPPDAGLASAIVWFDAFLTNVDRTARNPNLLIWHKALWLIDNGAALYIQYSWGDYLAHSRSRFPQVKDHVLLPRAGVLAEADARLAPLITPALVRGILDAVPDDWLEPTAPFATRDELRAGYADYLLSRLQAPRPFAEEAIRARGLL